MAKKNSHYVKKSAKKYLTAKDKKMLIICAAAVVVLIAIFFIVIKLSDDSLKVRNGKIVDAGDNWLIANSGTVENAAYYKYGEYDFSGYDGEVSPGSVGYDDNATCVELYPADSRYDEGFIYASAKDPLTVISNVSSQIGYMLTDGEVSTPESFLDGYIYWYTNTETDEETEEVTYAQVFSAYLPGANDGSVIIRVTYRFDTADEYVDPETGYAECQALAECIKFE